ncbi:MAG: hypothetical protein IJM79_08220 [Erysipelotrichaceae bacterium]|nr:hypothetical protein [Erysipelotrichaceae bacterium]
MAISSAVLQHYHGYEELIKRLDDAFRHYERTLKPQALDFLAADELNAAESYLGSRVPYELFGGYPDAIRKRLVIGEELKAEDYIICLKAVYNTRFDNPDHRDLKGSVYNLGIDTAKIGDMWVRNGEMHVYAARESAPAVISLLQRVGRVKVNFQECGFARQEFEFEQMSINVSSLRLDSVASAIIRKSREKAKQMIEKGLINVNYKTIEDCTLVCNNSDILSIRMFGRFKIDNIVTNQRSGKYRISVRKFK